MSRTKPRCCACGSSQTSRQCDHIDRATRRTCGRYLCGKCTTRGGKRGRLLTIDYCPTHAPQRMSTAAFLESIGDQAVADGMQRLLQREADRHG